MAFEELGWEPPQITAELAALIEHTRDAEHELQEELQLLSAKQRNTLVRTMVIGDTGDACIPPLDMSLNMTGLCEACLEARGPFYEGDNRRLLRERARVYLRLAGNAHAVRSPQDLLALWDEATRREPRIRLFVDEPRWRTAEDGIPFTGAKLALIFGTLPLAPGRKTADPADIPQLAETIAEFARRDDLPPEVVAFGMSYLIFRIHPFMDGNGHTIRMFGCDIMHRAGYCEPTLLAYVDALYDQHDEMCDLAVDVALGRMTSQDHIAFHLGLVQQAQKTVLALLV